MSGWLRATRRIMNETKLWKCFASVSGALPGLQYVALLLMLMLRFPFHFTCSPSRLSRTSSSGPAEHGYG